MEKRKQEKKSSKLFRVFLLDFLYGTPQQHWFPSRFVVESYLFKAVRLRRGEIKRPTE